MFGKRYFYSVLVKGIGCLTLLAVAYMSIEASHRSLSSLSLSKTDDVERRLDSKSRCGAKDCSVNAIHLVVVACKGKSENTFIETLTMIKSATIFTKQLLHIHIFTETLKKRFSKEILRWPKVIRERFNLSIHRLQYPLSQDDVNEFKNWWGPCASFRIFLPTVMKDVDAVLYVDTDVIFLGPVDEIWNEFNKFDSKQVGGLASRVGWDFKVSQNNPNFISTSNGKLTQVNSGVFLMNLTRMRQSVFKTAKSISNGLSSWSSDFLIPLYKMRFKDMHGDQNLINTVFHYNPDLLYLIPCKYNYHHKFCFDGYRQRICESAEKDGAVVIHGNANTYYNNYAPAFRVINDVMKKYNFESDMKKYLLEPMSMKLKDPSVENHQHCGNKTELFLKIITSSILKKYPD